MINKHEMKHFYVYLTWKRVFFVMSDENMVHKKRQRDATRSSNEMIR